VRLKKCQHARNQVRWRGTPQQPDASTGFRPAPRLRLRFEVQWSVGTESPRVCLSRIASRISCTSSALFNCSRVPSSSSSSLRARAGWLSPEASGVLVLPGRWLQVLRFACSGGCARHRGGLPGATTGVTQADAASRSHTYFCPSSLTRFVAGGLPHTSPVVCTKARSVSVTASMQR
jgi:hypothetical protein